jgi:hypothetical protein
MPVTSYRSASVVVNDGGVGTRTWDSDDFNTALVGTEVQTDDNVYAGSQMTGSSVSNWLKCTSFGFTSSDVPPGATIDGIEIEVRQFRNDLITIASTALQLVKGGTISGSNIGTTGDWATSETVVVYGSPTTLGGLSFTDSDVTSSNFGVALSVTNNSARVSTIVRTRLVDQVRIRIHYTGGGGGGGGFDSKKASQFIGFF